MMINEQSEKIAILEEEIKKFDSEAINFEVKFILISKY